MKAPRDFQRSRVYLWGYKYITKGLVMSPMEAHDLLQAVREQYTLGPVAMREGPSNLRHAYAALPHEDNHNGIYEIVLPARPLGNWAWKAPIILHECAHILVRACYGHEAVAGHGPEFVETYIDLLVDYLYYDEEELRVAAALTGVEVCST